MGIYIKNRELVGNPRLAEMEKALVADGNELYSICSREDVRKGTDMVLSVGGDGTFLSASKRVADSGIPILGVNLGRLGFLSENRPEDIPAALKNADYELENRTMLKASLPQTAEVPDPLSFWPYALNEITVHRSGAAMLGINVSVNGDSLPTYWADGLLVATSSGSTAYSLSAGGPICTPDAKVLIIAPIAPHNLNVRPLVVPENTRINISTVSRDGNVILTMDNRTLTVDDSTSIDVSVAQFSLKRVRLPKSSFVKALTSKLFWGEDIRNNAD
ncbi:MAG: NAD(+)/NADH kinase [Bacteroidales bacterium]|nr:NAD(+)/NADH kinase [Bacteroidales bacterium]